jgi:hypothetical protein
MKFFLLFHSLSEYEVYLKRAPPKPGVIAKAPAEPESEPRQTNE